MRPKSRKAIDAYLSELLCGCGARVQKVPGCGRGLVATKAPSGKPPIIFGDGPLGQIVQAAFKSVPGLSCALCGHALGSPEHHLRRLLRTKGSGNKASKKIQSTRESPLCEPVSDVVPGVPLFTRGRQPLFCSTDCMDEHERIFLPVRQQLQAVRRFAQHARKCGCVFYLLAFKLICWVFAEWRRHGDAISAAAPLKVLYGRLYWDAVDAPEGEDAARKFRSQLQAETEQSRLLALAALTSAVPWPSGWEFLEPAGYAKLLGALCCNAIAVVYATPVVQHILQIDAMVDCPAKREAMNSLDPWVRALQERPQRPSDSDSDSDADCAHGPGSDQKDLVWETSEGLLAFSTALFPTYRGYAVFPRLSLANHSCQPTCAVEFTFAAKLFLIAQELNCIEKETELTISYLDASLGANVSSTAEARDRRRRLLAPYGFECACPRCAIEFDMAPLEEPTKCTRRHRIRRARKRHAEVCETGDKFQNVVVAVEGRAPVATHAQFEIACAWCDGTGQVLTEACPLCGGRDVVAPGHGSDAKRRRLA